MAETELISLEEAARRLRVSVKTVQRRCAEAGIRGLRPGSKMMLAEADYAALVAYLYDRAPALAPDPRQMAGRTAQEALRAVHRRETRRLVDGVRDRRSRKVVALDLERPLGGGQGTGGNRK